MINVTSSEHLDQTLSTTEYFYNSTNASLPSHDDISITTETLDTVFDTTEEFDQIISVGLLFYMAIMVTCLVFAIFSNFLVVYCVIRFTALRTVTNIFICNLSVSDILLAGFVMPQRLHDIFHKGSYHEGNLRPSSRL